MLGGFALFLGVVSLWYLPMYLLHGSDFLDTFLGVHNVLRATVSEHPRNNVWYYYLLVFLAGFLRGHSLPCRRSSSACSSGSFICLWASVSGSS